MSGPGTDGLQNRPTLGELKAILTKDQCEGPKLRIALPANAADDLRCLFFHGPTWDGNVPSKSGRDDLVRMGLAARGNGWQWLTPAGIQACFDNGIHVEKERREARDRQRRNVVNDLARTVLGMVPDLCSTGSGAIGAGNTAMRQDER